MKARIYLILLISISLIFSCQSKIDFKKSKEEINKSLTPIETISSYRLRFNPKANGTITIVLGNGAEYQADKINSSQLTSLLNLLQNNNLQFDTENEEFILNN